MDPESQRIIAQGARNHARFEEELAQMGDSTTESSEADTFSTSDEGSIHAVHVAIDGPPSSPEPDAAPAAAPSLPEVLERRDDAYDGPAPASPRRDESYEETVSQVKEVTKVASGGATGGRRDGGYNSEDDEDFSSTRRDASYSETGPQTKEVTKVAAGSGRHSRSHGYNSEDDEEFASTRRDESYSETGAQTKEVTKVAAGSGGYRRNHGYNSDDEEGFSSEGGFEASEESYGGHHYYEDGSGMTASKSSSSLDSYSVPGGGGGGARRDEPYDGYGGGTAGGRRDIPYDGSMASSSVAGSSEAYIATAMPNETKTNEASRQKGLTPIQRAAKRAMERDNPYIPLSDLIPAYHENPEGLKKALNTPIPYDHGVVQCTLRVRDDKKTLLFYLQPENRLLMIGHERRKMGGVNVMVSVVSQSKRHDPTYIGKIRSNRNFTEFWIYDGGIAPRLVGVNKEDAPPRKELAYVKYDLFSDAPRYMLVLTPKVRDDETWVNFVPHFPKFKGDDDGSMEAKYKAGKVKNIEVSYNRKPEWNQKLGRFELDIKNRAQLPSTKNFMISTRLDPNHDSVLMGKAAAGVFTISVQYPMTLFQGLGIAVTALFARTYK